MDDPVSPRLARMRAEVMNQLPNRSFVVTKATQDAVIAEENRKAVDDGRAAEPKPPSFKVSTPLPDSATVLEQLAALQDNVMRHAKHSKASLTRQHSKNLSHSFVSSADPLVSALLSQKGHTVVPYICHFIPCSVRVPQCLVVRSAPRLA